MRILDRYVARELLPVWIWCLVIFISLSCLIDLFGHLDEIIRQHIPPKTVLRYYLYFTPIVFVKASPIALLLGSAFVTTRLSRHQEFLAMSASGTSMLRASIPFLFVGWMVSALVFIANDRLIPHISEEFYTLQQETFRGQEDEHVFKNVAAMDSFNRLYHAQELDFPGKELTNLTVLEHDWHNRPTKSLHVRRAIWTQHGWLLLYGMIYRMDSAGTLRGDPEPFVERLITYPITPEAFKKPKAQVDSMSFSRLRLLVTRLKHLGVNVRSYAVDLISKLSLPLMNALACLIGFVICVQRELRAHHLRGLVLSLWWGFIYYLVVVTGLALGKVGVFPVAVAVWAPQLLTAWWCLRRLQNTR